jgi:hypothetical protein
MARDYQRQKVYRWENAQLWSNKTGGELTYEEIEVILKKLKPKAKLKRGRDGTRAHASFWGREITIPAWATTWSVVLHEIAHCLTPSPEHGAHGPEFVGCYCSLLYHFHPMHPEISELAESLRKVNVDFKGIHDWSKRFNRIKLTKEIVKKRAAKSPIIKWAETTQIRFNPEYPHLKGLRRNSSVSVKLTYLYELLNLNGGSWKWWDVEWITKKSKKEIKIGDLKYFIHYGYLESRTLDKYIKHRYSKY